MRVSQNFRLRLQNELNERCKNNARYSLRAFARSMQLESSALSRLIRGKRAITPKMFRHLSTKLDLAPQEIAKYLTPDTHQPTLNHHQFDEDTFNLMAQWQNFALIELVQTKGFKSDPRWMARRLNLSLSEVNLALERLKRLGFLEVDAKGKWHVRIPFTTTTNIPGTSAALKSLQKDVLKKALEAMDSVPTQERDQSSICLAVNEAMIPEVKERIKKFRREIMALMDGVEMKEQVYHLAVSFYPVSHSLKD